MVELVETMNAQLMGRLEQYVFCALISLGDLRKASEIWPALEGCESLQVSFQAMHSVLNRMGQKGWVDVFEGAEVHALRTKSVRYYRATKAGIEALRLTVDLDDRFTAMPRFWKLVGKEARVVRTLNDSG